MSTQVYLSLLKNVKFWNEWRINNPQKLVDLSQADLSNYNLQGVNFNNVNLIYANLSNTILNEVNLSKADLSNANLQGASIYKAYCYKANFTETNLSKANLAETDISLANFRSANLEGANLIQSYLIKADFSTANLTNANLSNATLTQAKLVGTNFNLANLENADLSSVDASYAEFNGANLTGVCIDQWIINDSTKLNEVLCNYIYLKANQKKILPNQNTFVDLRSILDDSVDTVDPIPNNLKSVIQKKLSTFDKSKIDSENSNSSNLKIAELTRKLNGLKQQKIAIENQIKQLEEELDKIH